MMPLRVLASGPKLCGDIIKLPRDSDVFVNYRHGGNWLWSIFKILFSNLKPSKEARLHVGSLVLYNYA